MEPELPKGFTDLETAFRSSNVEIDVIGVVDDFLPPKPTKGTDWMMTFEIKDLKSYGQFKCRFFVAFEDIPDIRGTGDVIIIRRAKVRPFSGQPMILNEKNRTTFCVFQQSNIPEKPIASDSVVPHTKSRKAMSPSFIEMQYAATLCNQQTRHNFTTPRAPFVSTGREELITAASSMIRDKFSLIQDINVDTFYDLFGQVVKVFPIGSRTDLYITDYTSNELLFNREGGRQGERVLGSHNDYAWAGPYGKMTLTVTLWESNSDFAQNNVRENDFVVLRNVHIKFGKDAVAKIEGMLHQDMKNMDRVDVKVVQPDADDRVKGLLKRKKEYYKQFKMVNEGFDTDARDSRRADSGKLPSGIKRRMQDEPRNLSKTQLKRKKKQESERLKNERIEANSNIQISNPGPEPEDKTARSRVELRALRNIQNPTIKCDHLNHETRTIASILDRTKHMYETPKGTSFTLPYMNVQSRAFVRVQDYFPKNIEDFTCKHYMSEMDILSDTSDGSNNEASQGKVQWKWRFGLTLTDASRSRQADAEKLKVYVAHEDAEKLLNMDAEDLRENQSALRQLKEKLFYLWGDLEEMNTEALKAREGAAETKDEDAGPVARPFECCIKEYGVRVRLGEGMDGSMFKRCFGLFGTTIA